MAFISFEQVRRRISTGSPGGGLTSVVFNVRNGAITNKFSASDANPVTIDFNFTGSGSSGAQVRVFNQCTLSGPRLFSVNGSASIANDLTVSSNATVTGNLSAVANKFSVTSTSGLQLSQLPIYVNPATDRIFQYDTQNDRWTTLGRVLILSWYNSYPTSAALAHLAIWGVTRSSADRGVQVLLMRGNGVAGRTNIFSLYSGSNISSGETLNLEAEFKYTQNVTVPVVFNFRTYFTADTAITSGGVTKAVHIRMQHWVPSGETRLSQQVVGIEAVDLRQWATQTAWFLYSLGGDNLFHGRMRINDGNFVLTGGGSGTTTLPTLRTDIAMMSVGHDLVSSNAAATQGIIAVSSFRPGGASTNKFAPGCIALQEYGWSTSANPKYTVIAPSSEGVLRFWTVTRSQLNQGRLETDFTNSWYLNGNEWLLQMPSILQAPCQDLIVYSGQTVTLEDEVMYEKVIVEAGGTLVLKCRLIARDRVEVYGTIRAGYGDQVNTKWLPSNDGMTSWYKYSIGTDGGNGGKGSGGNGQPGYSLTKLSTDPNAPVLDVPSLYYLRAFRTTTGYQLVGGGRGGKGGDGGDADGGNGGRPGGILFIVTRWLFVLAGGKLEAKGENGYNGEYEDDYDYGGGGGGGAGGIMILLCGERHFDPAATLDVSGGQGGLCGKPGETDGNGQPGQNGKIYLRYYV